MSEREQRRRETNLYMSFTGCFEVTLVKQDEDEDEGVLLFSKLDSYGPAKNRNYLPDPMTILDLIKENLGQPTISTEGQEEKETEIKKEEEKKDEEERASGKAEEEKEEKRPKRIAKRRAKMMN